MNLKNNRTWCNFHDIIKIEDSDFDNVLLDKNYLKIF